MIFAFWFGLALALALALVCLMKAGVKGTVHVPHLPSSHVPHLPSSHFLFVLAKK
jgi:hypothetical protein